MNASPTFSKSRSIAVGLSWVLGTAFGVMLVSGARLSQSVRDQTVRSFDPRTDRWEIIPDLAADWLQAEPDGRVRFSAEGDAQARLWNSASGQIEEGPASADEVVAPLSGTFRDLRSAPGRDGHNYELAFTQDAQGSSQTTIVVSTPGVAGSGGGWRKLIGALDLPTMPVVTIALGRADVTPLLMVDPGCGATMIEGGSAAPVQGFPWQGDCWGLALAVLASGDVLGMRGHEIAVWTPGARSIQHRNAPVTWGHAPALATLPDGRVLVAGGGLPEVIASSPSGIMALVTGALLLALSLATLVVVRRRIRLGWAALGLGIGAVLGGLAFLGFIATHGSGRPLRVGKRLVLPRLRFGSGRRRAPQAAREPGPGYFARALAQRFWRRAARFEASSVPTFRRLAAELEALGAPPELVARALVAAQDEARHAALCLAIVAEVDGRELRTDARLTAWMETPVGARLAADAATRAREALVEGVYGEGLAAQVAASAATQAEGAIADALRAIAIDEARHAALAADVVAWCLATGDAAVAVAVADARRALAEAGVIRPTRGARDPSGALGRLGLFTEADPGALDAAVRAGLLGASRATPSASTPPPGS